MYSVWVRCSTRRVGNDLLKDPVAPGSPTFFPPFSAISPPHPYWCFPRHTFLPLFLSSLHFIPSSASLLPLFWSQLCNSANDAEKACCQHILQAARAWLHKLVNRAGPLPCQPLIIIRREMRNERRRRMGWKEEEWGKCEALIFYLSVTHASKDISTSFKPWGAWPPILTFQPILFHPLPTVHTNGCLHSVEPGVY